MPSGETTSTADRDADRRLDELLELLARPGRRRTASTSSRRSTRTVISSSVPVRLSTHWKCGDSAGTASSSSSIWVGNRFTPRRMIMSSVRPVTFSIRRMVRAVPGQQPGQVAGAVADHRHRLLGQRGEDQLALLAVGQHLAGDRVDDLRVEVVLPDVQPVLGLDALLRDARADHLGQPVDVDRVDAEDLLHLDAHLVGPRLGAEDADLQRRLAAGRGPGGASRRRSRACTTGSP